MSRILCERGAGHAGDAGLPAPRIPKKHPPETPAQHDRSHHVGMFAGNRRQASSSGTAKGHGGGSKAARASDDDVVSAFVDSMPARYRDHFDLPTARAHAAIARRRGDRVVSVEAWRTLPDGSVALCIVADDRAGLLSLISGALVFHDLDVVAAQAYGHRSPSGAEEVVDLFWVRRLAGMDIDQELVGSIADVLRQLIDGQLTVETIARRAAGDRRAARGASTRVRFDGDRKEGLAVLTVETVDRPGLLLAMCQALFALRVQIVRSEVRTIDGQVHNRFEVAEFDGAPVGKLRRMQIQVQVLSAIEATRGPSSGDGA
jgi:UTP:GlnB (protein PII) uridylyltransferase